MQTITFIILFALFEGTCFAQKSTVANKEVTVLELRNYLCTSGDRDRFIDSFKVYIEDTQNARNAYIIGMYTVKNAPDNFFWLRAFTDMSSRKEALTGLYSSEYWAKASAITSRFQLNYDNVHLLKPIDIVNGDTNISFNTSRFFDKQFVVIDFYIANGRRNELIAFFREKYNEVLKKAGIEDICYWIAVSEENTYPRLPMFQDSNLLVSIGLFNSDDEYNKKMKKLNSILTKELNNALLRIMTRKDQVLLRSLSAKDEH